MNFPLCGGDPRRPPSHCAQPKRAISARYPETVGVSLLGTYTFSYRYVGETPADPPPAVWGQGGCCTPDFPLWHNHYAERPPAAWGPKLRRSMQACRCYAPIQKRQAHQYSGTCVLMHTANMAARWLSCEDLQPQSGVIPLFLDSRSKNSLLKFINGFIQR